MRFKRVIAISMIVAGSLLGLILIIGLFVPASVLNRIGGEESTTETIKTIDGKKMVEVVNPATGETITTTTDPNTGQTTTTSTSATGETKVVPNGTTASSNTNTTSPPPSGGTTGGSTTGGGTTGGGTTPTAKPTVTISVSPSTITSGASSTIGWSATNSPTSCTASGSWSGSKPASGTQSVAPTSSVTYTLSCTNAGGSDSKSAAITVNAPVAACGQPGGVCSLSDIQGHSTAGDCRSAINSVGSGISAYAISSSFLTLHQPKRTITSTLCGKVYTGNLRNKTGDHQNGATLGGSAYQTWMNNFYIGPYN